MQFSALSDIFVQHMISYVFFDSLDLFYHILHFTIFGSGCGDKEIEEQLFPIVHKHLNLGILGLKLLPRPLLDPFYDNINSCAFIKELLVLEVPILIFKEASQIF